MKLEFHLMQVLSGILALKFLDDMVDDYEPVQYSGGWAASTGYGFVFCL